MFTGIVSAVGQIQRARAVDGGVDLTVRAPYRGLKLGESIAVAGVCLTVTARGPGWFRVRVVSTTLESTLFGTFERGRRVNLERALRTSDRLGGHLVQGHVDGIGEIRQAAERNDATLLDVRVLPAVARVTVPTGSIAIDGVSMTVKGRRRNTIQLSVVPFTRRHTTLGDLRRGDRVHVEADVLGKYVEQLMQCHLER